MVATHATPWNLLVPGVGESQAVREDVRRVGAKTSELGGLWPWRDHWWYLDLTLVP
jgi:hypothetical protein